MKRPRRIILRQASRDNHVEAEVKMNRREAIAIIGALPLSRWIILGSGEVNDETGVQRKTFYDLIAVWHRAPEGPVKEQAYQECYRAGVVSGALRSIRDPAADRQLELEHI